VGDVGADGLDDLALGFPELSNDRGEVYVVQGSEEFDGDISLGDLSPPAGYRLEGESSSNNGNIGDRLGITLSAVGNLVGGDAADLLLGATYFGSDEGRTYVVDGFPPAEDVTSIEDVPGHHLTGVIGSARLGYRVAGRRGGAHFDSGPTPDYVVSLRPENEDQRVYVVFGEQVTASFSFDVPDPPVLQIDQTGVGTSDPLSLAIWSDLGGDDRDELVMAAPGRITVLYGRELDPASSTTSTGALTPDQGFAILADDPGERLEVAPAGDVDGDGYEDLLVGAPEADGGDGRAYIVHGAAAKCAG
jgi:hypothetical protein